VSIIITVTAERLQMTYWKCLSVLSGIGPIGLGLYGIIRADAPTLAH